MKMVELEDETNMVGRVIENCLGVRGSAMFNIMASKRIFRCGDVFINFIHFLPSRVSRIKINLKIIKFN